MNQITDVQEVETHLELVLLLASLKAEILSDTQVEAMHPRRTSCISFSILALVVLQIAVLIDVIPESLTHFGVVDELTIVKRTDLNLAVVGGDIHQVITDTVSIHIVGIGIAQTCGRIATIEEVDVCATRQTLVGEGDVVAHRSDELIGHNIARTLYGSEVRAVDGIQTLPS